jgi:hypothetical protein
MTAKTGNVFDDHGDRLMKGEMLFFATVLVLLSVVVEKG